MPGARASHPGPGTRRPRPRAGGGRRAGSGSRATVAARALPGLEGYEALGGAGAGEVAEVVVEEVEGAVAGAAGVVRDAEGLLGGLAGQEPGWGLRLARDAALGAGDRLPVRLPELPELPELPAVGAGGPPGADALRAGLAEAARGFGAPGAPEAALEALGAQLHQQLHAAVPALDVLDALLEGQPPGWGGELLRELLVQAAHKAVLVVGEGLPPGVPFPTWGELEAAAGGLGRLAAAALPGGVGGPASPGGVAAAFALALALLVQAALGGVGGDGEDGQSEWARLAAAEGDEEPDLLKVYDPEVAKRYFLQRPATLVKRGWRSSVLLGWFSTCIFLDAKLGRRPEDDDEAKAATDATRAAQLRSILIRLGPTYVKLGQVLSSRQDLLPTPYVKELETLQDSVPPFDDAIAMRMIQRELGARAAARLEYLEASPVASASLGQVYVCRDKLTGKKVAVKVQRPGALCAVALDVAIIRVFGPPLYKINDRGGNLDAKGLIDEWGSRFVDELDYRLEAENARRFQTAMNARRDALGDAVFAPSVASDLSARRILTAEWVEGCKLDAAEDTGRLCAITLSAYLAMLLETGTLHVDPHPGNLLYAEDGRVCILDWG